MREGVGGTMANPKACLSLAGDATESVVVVTLIGVVGARLRMSVPRWSWMPVACVRAV